MRRSNSKYDNESEADAKNNKTDIHRMTREGKQTSGACTGNGELKKDT